MFAAVRGFAEYAKIGCSGRAEQPMAYVGLIKQWLRN